jgi:hypothetical protein
MNEVVMELSRPVWWISVVVAGIIINLLSAYLKPSLDKYFSSTSSWWRNRSEKRRAVWVVRVERIVQDEKFERSEVESEVRLRLLAIHSLLLAIFLIVLASAPSSSKSALIPYLNLFFTGMAGAMLFVSFLIHRSATNVKQAIQEARKKPKKPALNRIK